MRRIDLIRRRLAKKPEPSWDRVAQIFEEATKQNEQTIASFESLAETYQETENYGFTKQNSKRY